MKTVGEILSARGRNGVTMRPDESVLEALNVMTGSNIGAVMVVDGRRPVGIFSERDFTRKVLLANLNPAATKLNDVMTRDVLYASPELTVEECLSRMNRRGVRHLPVVKDGEAVGCVSILEVVDAVLRQREVMINNLERYVSETWPL